MLRISVLILLLLAAVSPSLAQDASGAAEPGRFTFKEVSDGILRFDTGSGAVSFCSKRVVGWACQTVADDRAAVETEIGRLEQENAALRRELVAHGIALPSGAAPPASSSETNPPGSKIPTDAELDRAMAFLQKVWRRVVEMVEEMQQDLTNDDPHRPRAEP